MNNSTVEIDFSFENNLVTFKVNDQPASHAILNNVFNYTNNTLTKIKIGIFNHYMANKIKIESITQTKWFNNDLKDVLNLIDF